MRTKTLQFILLVLLIGVATSSCSPNRVSQLEAQVADLTSQNETLTKENQTLKAENYKLQSKLDEFDHNNRVVYIEDQRGLRDKYFSMGVPAVLSNEKTLITIEETRTFFTTLEVEEGRPFIYGLNNSAEKIYLEGYLGETIVLDESHIQDDGHTYLEYTVCYTNNLGRCRSYVTITNIMIK